MAYRIPRTKEKGTQGCRENRGTELGAKDTERDRAGGNGDELSSRETERKSNENTREEDGGGTETAWDADAERGTA